KAATAAEYGLWMTRGFGDITISPGEFGACLKRNLSSAFGRAPAWRGISGGDGGAEAAAHVEFAAQGHAARRAACHQIVQNLVGDMLVVDAAIAVTLQVHLQAFQL